MLKQLEYATRAHHVAADAARLSLFGSAANRERYVDFLVRTFAFEAPIEERWLCMPELDRVIDVWRRIGTGFLASDLRALGCPQDVPEPGPCIGIEQALGWMFVVERGRRLNGMLHRHLARRIPDVIETAGSFLTASSSSGSRWDQLGTALDRVAYNHRAAAQQVINAAQRAFRTLRTVNGADAACRVPVRSLPALHHIPARRPAEPSQAHVPMPVASR